MIYEILLRDKRGYANWVQDSILPGLVPDHVFDLMECRHVHDVLDLCRLCDVQGARCHVFEVVSDDGEYGRKMCPILFADAVKPKWSVNDVV